MTTLQELPQIRGVKNIPVQEGYTSGHRTCQGCESALVMRLMIKAAGPRTIVVGSTGCMYVANTTYYSTPWVVPWMHTQLGSSGSAATGTAAGLASQMRQGQDEGRANQRHRLLRRRRRRGHGPLRHLRRPPARRVQPAHPLLRQRVLRQHRHPGLRQLPLGRQLHLQPSGQEAPDYEPALEEEHRPDAGNRTPGLPLRRHRLRLLRPRLHQQDSPRPHHRRPHLHPQHRPLPQGLGLRPQVLSRTGNARRPRPASGSSTKSWMAS